MSENIATWVGKASSNEFILNYYDNNWLSISLDFIFVLVPVTLFWIAIKLFRVLGCHERVKRKISSPYLFTMHNIFWLFCEVVLGILVLVLVTCLLLLLTAFNRWASWIGMVFTFVLWFLSFVHFVRARDARIYGVQQELRDAVPVPSTPTQQSDDDDYGGFGLNNRNALALSVPTDPQPQQEEQRTLLAHTKESTVANLRYYLASIGLGFLRRWWILIPGCIFFFVAAIVVNLLVCNFCVPSQPIQLSTWLTRRSEPKLCQWGKVCFLYATVPEDLSNSLIINYQTYSTKPLNSSVLFSTTPFNTTSLNSTDLDTIYAATVAKPSCVRVEVIEDEDRYHCFAELVGLTPDTTYFVAAQIELSTGVALSDVYKFRTSPPTSSGSPIMFANGGDVRWSEGGTAVLNQAFKSEILFFLLVGDIWYENAVSFCYKRVDLFFVNYQTLLTPSGYSVPLLTGVGNHEAGGFKRPKSDDTFYLHYFPHELTKPTDKDKPFDPLTRNTMHAHVFANHTVVIILDAWIHETIESQVTYLRNQLTKYQNLTNRIVTYHQAAFPTKVVLGHGEASITADILKYWVPVFDTHNATLCLEHHYHNYKVSKPIKYGNVVERRQGTMYIGDGSLGVSGGKETPTASKLILDTANYPCVNVVTSTAINCDVVVYATNSTSSSAIFKQIEVDV